MNSKIGTLKVSKIIMCKHTCIFRQNKRFQNGRPPTNGLFINIVIDFFNNDIKDFVPFIFKQSLAFKIPTFSINV